MPPWTATALTILPEAFPGPLGLSLAGQALARGDLIVRIAGEPAQIVDRFEVAAERSRQPDGCDASGGC